MKKNLISIFSIVLVLLSAGCKKESEGVTEVMDYVNIQLLGDNPYVSLLGGDYEEPGFTATYKGQDYSSNVTVKSNVNPTYPGIYSVTYSAKNPQGYDYPVTRDVYVLNPGGVANIYLATCQMGSTVFRNIVTVVSEVSKGVYQIDDLCGGYYYAGRYPGYEPTYNFHATTTFTLGEDGSINVLKANSWYFVNSFDYSNISGGFDFETCVFDYDFDGLKVKLIPFEL